MNTPAVMGMPALADATCYLNGQFVALRDAQVSVLDRGFIFGDGIYDVVPVYGRKLFRFDAHLARLQRGLGELRIPNPYDREGWLSRIRHLVSTQAADDQIVYIQVTRGVAVRDHAMPAGLTPTVFMMTNPLKPASDAQRREGVACVTAEDFRWARADIKSVSLLGNVMARQISADVGATETILLRDGFVTEGSSSNVWVVQRGTVLAPPRSRYILEGIRLALVEELCAAAGIPLQMRPVTEAELRGAVEIMVSSASKELLPVTRLDDRPVGPEGRPGPVYRALFEAYQRAKADQSL